MKVIPALLFGCFDKVANIALSEKRVHVFDLLSYPPLTTGRSIELDASTIRTGLPVIYFFDSGSLFIWGKGLLFVVR